ncbi:S9 family peptidase [Sphingomonas oleivorans]|uniref:S9 family peptidase n=1 Tax=Sphingomonas oleivorans TaxID=1735121 RepID=A0A2T5G1Q2_9SPHN|nr:S9 family peptidase [Sphingomonas oleivorans]PTQ13076.1 S9 family peptidase [Sphingomonas oleivorans]
MIRPIVLLLSLLLPVCVASAAPRPIEQFAALPFISAPELSPRGDRIAARVAVNGTQYLMIHPIFDGSAQPTLIPVGDNDLNWFQWVNDDWLVIGVGAMSPVGSEQWYIRRAIGVSADGKKTNVIAAHQAAQNADDLLWIARDGSSRILLALQKSIYSIDPGFWPEVVEVDVSTGRTKTVVRPVQYVMNWYADGAGTVRMGVGYNDDTQTSRLLYRGSASERFHTVDRADRRKGESLLAPALFLDGGKAIAVNDQDGFDALYEMDLATLSLGKRIFGAAGYDLDALLAGADGKSLAGARFTDTRRRVHWFDPVLTEVQRSIDQAVGDRHAEIVSMNRDRTKLLVEVGSADQAGALYYYDLADGAMQRIAWNDETLKNTHLHPVKTIRFKARDGLEIPAVLTLPKGLPTKDLPLIVLPHGGPFARDSESWDWWVQFLADRGYAVIQPNYRGSSGFGTAFAEKGEGEWGLKMQDDLDDARAYMIEQGIADPKRVCMVGASYGGYAAMRAAQRNGSLYRCAIAYAGVSDLGAMRRYDSRFLNSKGRSDWLKRQAPDFRAVSPVFDAGGFSTPILLMHGKKDRTVPVSQSREMAEKLKAAGKPHIYIEQPLADHHFSRADDRLLFLREMEKFLNEHNPAG